MKKILVLVFFIVFFSLSQLFAGIFDGADANWNNSYLKITNISINGETYWADFEYDSSQNIFKFNSYGKIENSTTYCREMGMLGANCDYAKFDYNLSGNNISGIFNISGSSYNFTGQCNDNLCNIATDKSCKGTIYFGSSSVTVNFMGGLDMSCYTLTAFSGTYKSATSDGSLPFDYVKDQDFFNKFPSLATATISAKDDKICFDTTCYQLDSDTANLTPVMTSENTGGDKLLNEAMDYYQNNSIYSELQYPYVYIGGGKGFSYDEYAFLVDSLLYVIKLKACPYSGDNTYVHFTYFKDDTWSNFSYLTPNIQLSSTPVPFTASNGYIELFSQENPLPGTVLKSLKDSGILALVVGSECGQHTPSNQEEIKLIFIDTENLKNQ